MLIDNLERCFLKMGVSYSVYSNYLCGDTLQDILSSMCALLNKVVDNVNEYNKIVDALKKWIEEEGLQNSVDKKLEEMIDDGTFDNIINGKIFSDLTSDLTNLTNNFNSFVDDKYNPLKKRVDDLATDNVVNGYTLETINYGGTKTSSDVITYKGNKNYINTVGGEITGTGSTNDVIQNFVVSGDNVKIDNQNLNGNSPHRALLISSGENKLINNSTIKSVSSGIVVDNPNVKNVEIYNSKIDARGYGVLVDQNTLTSENVKISDNIIRGGSDAIEINSPTKTVESNEQNVLKNVLINNNYIEQYIEKGSDSSAGFGIGVAGTNGIIISQNIIKDSKVEGIHIEDTVKKVVVTNNIVETSKKGIALLRNYSNKSYTDKTILCSNNSVYGKDGATIGIETTLGGNVNGSLETVNLSNNIIVNFNTGLFLNSENTDSRFSNSFIDGTIIEDCNTGATIRRNAIGNLIFKNCTTLVEMRNGLLDGIICDTPMDGDKIIKWNLDNGAMAKIKRISYRSKDKTSSNSGTQKLKLFSIGDYINGDISVSCKIAGGGSKMNISGKIDSSEEVNKFVRKYQSKAGVIDDGKITIEGGFLYFTYYDANGSLTLSVNVDFNGQIIKTN